MATQYVIQPFLDVKGRLCKPGEKAPNESEDNLKIYRDLGLIGNEAETESALPDVDVGRPGKAATRKTTRKKQAAS